MLRDFSYLVLVSLHIYHKNMEIYCKKVFFSCFLIECTRPILFVLISFYLTFAGVFIRIC